MKTSRNAVVSAITPFGDDGRLDEELLRAQLRRLKQQLSSES